MFVSSLIFSWQKDKRRKNEEERTRKKEKNKIGQRLINKGQKDMILKIY